MRARRRGIVSGGRYCPCWRPPPHATRLSSSSFAGNWRGPGEIVAGKYKGTKFSCNLIGSAVSDGGAGIKLDGSCRVGVFKQPMSALITQSRGGYKGKFLDGAAGKGLDVVSGTVTQDTVVVGLNRAKLNGAMIARVARRQDDERHRVGKGRGSHGPGDRPHPDPPDR